jgi:hypothetical protein
LEDLVSLQWFSSSYDTLKPFSFLKEQQQILVPKCSSQPSTRNLMRRQPQKFIRKRRNGFLCPVSVVHNCSQLVGRIQAAARKKRWRHVQLKHNISLKGQQQMVPFYLDRCFPNFGTWMCFLVFYVLWNIKKVQRRLVDKRIFFSKIEDHLNESKFSIKVCFLYTYLQNKIRVL